MAQTVGLYPHVDIDDQYESSGESVMAESINFDPWEVLTERGEFPEESVMAESSSLDLCMDFTERCESSPDFHREISEPGKFSAKDVKSEKGGFSLIELLAVLVIMGMLGALVGPRLFTQVDNSRVDTAMTQVRMLKASMQTFRLDVGRYPNSEEGLNALITAPADVRNWRGPYLEDTVPNDPWGNPYVYRSGENSFQGFVLYSRGADGKEGGTDLDKDIGFLPDSSEQETGS